MTTVLKAIRGPALVPHPSARRFSFLADVVIHIDERGAITAIDEATSEDEPVTWPGTVIVPGFVDAHVHFPQTRILGSASGPLLDWLQASVFPEEARFADRRYAESVARQFCVALLAQGTTSAAIYSSSHPEATDALFAELDRAGLRAQAGLTLMNRGAPDDVLLDTGPALDACEALIERWHDHDRGRLRFCVTPRFALSCDDALLRGAAELAARHELHIQTHISENLVEIETTAAAFPGSRDYLGVYEDHGLVGARSIFAHGIHLSGDEWGRLATHDCAVAHCPDSNFFLGSGVMPLAASLERGIRIGLGSDVGAGRTFSMRRIAASAYDASLLRTAPVTPEALLWLATRGGALAIGFGDRIGCLAPGFEADLVAIDVDANRFENATDAQRIDTLLFDHDAPRVRATVVRGAVRWAREAPLSSAPLPGAPLPGAPLPGAIRPGRQS